MDRAAIFEKITERNAVRKKAQLPLLDVRAEFEHDCSVAAMAEYSIFCGTKQVDLELITKEVLAEHPQGYSGFGRMYLNRLVQSRFEDFVRTQYGVVRPAEKPRNTVRYGKGF
ncbi:hypothetical protein ACFQS7_29310 [Dankookia sp. GCM10030260]|uniref:hypothetical protein n=1 Tax=Dankookia sp. GCM10030260 TaxID=3273390 RepID=UPI003619F86E